MSTHEQPGSVADALRALDQLRADAQARQQGRLAEVDEEIARLEESITNLQSQIATLQESRREIEQSDETAAIPGGPQKLFEVLRAQASVLAQRAQAWSEAVAECEARKEQALQSPEIAPLVAEFQQFKEGGEAALAQLPPSYRKAIEEVHNKVRRELEGHLERLSEVPVLDVEPIKLDVVFSADEGLVMLITPLSEQVYTQWASGSAGLDNRVAAKVVESLYSALRGTPVEAAEAMYGGHEGLLAMELEIPPDLEGFPARLESAFEQVLGASAEIQGAKVNIQLVSVPIDLLLPGEEEEGEDA